MKLKNGNEQFELTQKEQRAGGRASVKARRQKKMLKELLIQFGNMDIKDPKVRNAMEKLGLNPDDMTNDMALVIGQFTKAQKGDTSAATFIRDTKGEKPVDKIEQTVVAPKPLIDLTDRKKNGEDNGAK